MDAQQIERIIEEEILRDSGRGIGVAARAATRIASADTHPKDGDVKQAPLVSGAVPEGQTPKGSLKKDQTR